MPAPSPSPPSGQQVEIRSGNQRAVVVEIGGGLRVYEVDGQSVLQDYPESAMCDGGHGQVLMPWPNRLADGRYTFQGQSLQVPLTEPARQNANHGLVRWSSWRVIRQQANRAVVKLNLRPQPGYPFHLGLQVEYTLAEHGLTVQTFARNLGATPAPFGAGFHPYLTVGTPSVDAADLRLPASSVLHLDERGIPTGQRQPVDTAGLDFRSFRRLGNTRLDHCFTDLQRDADGLARASLRAAAGGPSATLWLDGAFRYLMAFTGDTLAPERRRTGLALEPMTCPPNAFQSGVDLLVLEPGGPPFSAAWGINPFD